MRLSFYNYYTFSHLYIPLKSFHGLRLLGLSRYEIDLSNEAVNIDFNQGAAKISKVKAGGRKKIADSAWFEPMHL